MKDEQSQYLQCIFFFFFFFLQMRYGQLFGLQDLIF